MIIIIIFFVVLFAAFLIDLIILIATFLIFLITVNFIVLIADIPMELIADFSKEGLYCCTQSVPYPLYVVLEKNRTPPRELRFDIAPF